MEAEEATAAGAVQTAWVARPHTPCCPQRYCVLRGGMKSAPRTHATAFEASIRTVVATEVTVVAEAEAEEATAAGVAQATWARPYPNTIVC